MILRTTKIQLVVFAVITLLGVSYVGATYANLDRLFTDDTYTVTANFAESGGIFSGAEVTYRGVGVGQVGEMRLSRDGVFVDMELEESADPIPEDVVAQVANRSALGEQYIDLQPKRQGEPYLENGATIEREDTATPIATSKLLTDMDALINSVGRRDLRVAVDELGKAFQGTGRDLRQIIDTSTSYIETADDYFGLTEQLIRDGRTVLRTQLESQDAIETFSTNLARLSDTLVAKDRDIRRVIDSGRVAADEVRGLIEDNSENLGVLINNSLTMGEITVARLHGFEQLLVMFPYVVEASFATTAKDPVTGLYEARLGIVLTEEPHVCRHGYESTDERHPQDVREIPMDTALHCAERAGQSSPRGAQHHPPPLNRAALNRASAMATYDPSTGEVMPAGEAPATDRHSTAGQAQLMGKDSWKWLLQGPLVTNR